MHVCMALNNMYHWIKIDQAQGLRRSNMAKLAKQRDSF